MESTDKLRILETLFNELTKDFPEEKIVKSCMHAAGISDGKTPAERITKVLNALNFESDKEIPTNELNK